MRSEGESEGVREGLLFQARDGDFTDSTDVSWTFLAPVFCFILNWNSISCFRFDGES